MVDLLLHAEVSHQQPPCPRRALEHLKGLTNLHQLNVNGTQTTDAGLEHLKGLTSLRWLHLSGGLFGQPQVTDAGVKRLQQILSNCKIEQ